MTAATEPLCSGLTDLAAAWVEEAKLARRAGNPRAAELDRAATQLRFVRMLVTEGIYDATTGYAWLTTGRRLLDQVKANRAAFAAGARA